MNDELRVKNNELGGKMNYRYRTDEEMKDSGVEWIGKIPKEWNVTKLKNLATIVTGNTPSKNDEKNYENGIFQWIKPDNITDDFKITESKDRLSTYGLKQARLIPKNSALVCCIGTVGKVGISEVECTTNQQINSVVFDNKNWVNGFGIYALISSRNEHERNSSKVVVSILNKSQQGNINMPVPKSEEQQKISKFLNEKTAQFDSIISKKEALIEKLEEAKKSLISEVVTGKVKVVKTNDGYELVERKKEEMKDSGVEWLGLVPKGWKIIKLKYLATLMNKKVKSNSVDKYIGLENVESKTGFIISYTDPEKVESDLSTYFDRNMVLFGKLRPYLAKCVVTETSGICSDEFLVLRTLRLSPNILKYIMLNSEFIDLVNSSTYGAKMPRANWDFISNIKVPFFSADEQTIIEEFIIYKCNSIDKIINIKKQQIEKLKEAKQSLISEAVTGKIEILD